MKKDMDNTLFFIFFFAQQECKVFFERGARCSASHINSCCFLYLWFWLSHRKLLNHLRYRASIQLRTDGDGVFIFLCNDIVKGDLVAKTFGFFAVHLGFNICIDARTAFQTIFFKQNRFQTKFVGRTGCDV